MWMKHASAVSAPSWAPDGTKWRQRMDGGVECWTHDDCGASAPHHGWFDCGDGWHALLLDGELPPVRSIDDAGSCRIADGTTVSVLTIRDIRTRAWACPSVIDPSGAIALRRPFARGHDGLPIRVATPLQQRLINAASFLRELATSHDESAPIECEIDCVAELLAAPLHITPYGLVGSGLLDDMLCIGTIAACMGVPQEDE